MFVGSFLSFSLKSMKSFKKYCQIVNLNFKKLFRKRLKKLNIMIDMNAQFYILVFQYHLAMMINFQKCLLEFKHFLYYFLKYFHYHHLHP